MENRKKIVVLAGTHEQFRYWLRTNVIPVVCKDDLRKIRSLENFDLFTEGTFYDWADAEALDEIEARRDKGQF